MLVFVISESIQYFTPLPKNNTNLDMQFYVVTSTLEPITTQENVSKKSVSFPLESDCKLMYKIFM